MKAFDTNLIVQLKNQGLMNFEIAKELGCCNRTVKNHLKKSGLKFSDQQEDRERIRKMQNEIQQIKKQIRKCK